MLIVHVLFSYSHRSPSGKSRYKYYVMHKAEGRDEEAPFLTQMLMMAQYWTDDGPVLA